MMLADLYMRADADTAFTSDMLRRRLHAPRFFLSIACAASFSARAKFCVRARSIDGQYSAPDAPKAPAHTRNNRPTDG